ncbi:unnamed protein product [Absidia cylindrospora]
MTTFAPPSSFLTSQQGHPSRRVHLTNRYGHQRRPLPMPVAVAAPPSTKKKSVRFCSDNDLEHVRFFIKTQMPLAAAQDPLPPKQRMEIKYPGWPSKWAMYKSLATSTIKMEQVMLAQDNGYVLKGRCRVVNLAYEKQVVVRYSFDQWQTCQEHIAVYREPIIASTASTPWDRFTFEITVPHHDETTTLACSMALKYQVNGQTWWDNNDGMNYPLQLTTYNDDVLYQPSLHTDYQDFISKYCFYNNSSILQN